MGSVSPIWEYLGLCLVTKKIKDCRSKGMFAKSTTLNKEARSEEMRKSVNINPETLIAL